MKRSLIAAVLGLSVITAARAQGFTQITLTITPGTASCGGPRLSPSPSPPLSGALFGDTGCAAPIDDATGLGECESGAAWAFAQFAATTIRCLQEEARGVFQNGGSSTAITDADQACETGDRMRSARARLERALGRLECPAAVQTHTYEDALLAGPDSLDAMNGEVYCDSSGGAFVIDPSGHVTGSVPGPHNPAGEAVIDCEDGVWSNVVTLIRRLTRCRIEATGRSKGRAADETRCQGAALSEYDTNAGELIAGGGCPPCLDGSGQARVRDDVLARWRRLGGLIYTCSAGGPGFSKIADLGQGCLYLPFARGVSVPDGATKALDVTLVSGSTLTLGGGEGTGPADCTKGAGPGRHCLNSSDTPCTTDADCGDVLGACAFDANCFFVQPIPVANGALSLCLLDVIESDEMGTADLMTGSASVMEHHTSRAYLTSTPASPCPRCVSGVCTAGKNAGRSCTTIGSKGTSIDCPPSDGQFIASLQLRELFTTGGSESSDFGAGFCPGQTVPGAFGRTDALRIAAMGSAAGKIGDLQLHPAALAAVFCIPSTGNVALDFFAKLPGPGMVSGAGIIQIQ